MIELRFGVNYGYWVNMKAQSWPDWPTLIACNMKDLIDQCGVDVQQRHYYEPSYHPSMQQVARHVFPGMNNIIGSYSQSMQDIFVLCLLNGKCNGTYLELGSYDPVEYNNTYLLTKFGWDGISIDINQSLEQFWRNQRPHNRFMPANALTIDYTCLLQNMPTQIDYLQIDIDQGQGDLDVLHKILTTGKRFSVITFEHEHEWQIPSWEILQSNGYELLVKNVVCKDFVSDTWHVFEDWWIDPYIVDTSIKEKFRNIEAEKTYPFELFCQPGSVDFLMTQVLAQKDIWKDQL